MQKTITCKNCSKTVPANPRLKGNQEYCNAKECQNARKRANKEQRKAADPEGFAKREKKKNETYNKNKPMHQYMDNYRQTHLDYTKKNRIQQRRRNRKRKKFDPEKMPKKIVKSDTLEIDTEKTGIYQMQILFPNESEKIVKSDALIVQLQKYQPENPGLCRIDT
jgi:hypothetical protein